MKMVFDQAKVIVDGETAYLCIAAPYQAARKFVGEKKPGKQYAAEIKEYRKSRSLDANAYAWVLLGKLAAKLSLPQAPITPEDIYREAIRDVGDNYEVTPIRDDAVEHWKAIWSSKGTGWICDDLGPSKIEGYTNIRNFYGSSVYDTAQMSRLIDVIVEACKKCGIETLPPEELRHLTEEWK